MISRFDETRLQTLFASFAGKRIAVIGDVMLDRYYWGGVSRISPEAPVPVVDVRDESIRLGGAANVANNIVTLKGVPIILGVVGHDNAGREISALYRQIDQSHNLIVDADRPTTMKTRVIADSQHVVRFDHESREDISHTTQNEVFAALQEVITTLDGVILEDYNKGVLVQPLIGNIIALANKHDIPVMVDPKFKNFSEYKNVTVFKPNKKEFEDALGVNLDGDGQLEKSAAALRERIGCKHLLVTLGAKGMFLYDDDGVARVATYARKVADVSGAGDTVIATLTVAFVSGATIREAAVLANYAAGLACEESGIVPVKLEALYNKIADDMFEPSRSERTAR